MKLSTEEINRIKAIICHEMNISISQLMSKTRKLDSSKARQIFMYIMREKYGYSFQSAGKEINKDHATVIHSVKSVNNYLDTDFDFKQKYNEILRKIEHDEIPFREVRKKLKKYINEMKTIKTIYIKKKPEIIQNNNSELQEKISKLEMENSELTRQVRWLKRRLQLAEMKKDIINWYQK